MEPKHYSIVAALSLSVFFAAMILFQLYPTKTEIADLVERDYKHYYEHEIEVEKVNYAGNYLYDILYDKDGVELHATYNYAVPTLCLEEEQEHAKPQNQASAK